MQLVILPVDISSTSNGEAIVSATMCDLAPKLPRLIGVLLDRERHLKRGRFREETMTDLFTGALAAFAGPNLVIQYPVELDTGGDLDLHFWHAESNRSLCVRIQAKRLSAEMNGSQPVKMKHRAYNELLHWPPTGKDYQFRILRDTPNPLVPLYIFYNHESVTLDPEFAGATPGVRGINLAFARDIANELEAKLDAAGSSPRQIKHHKRLSHLRKHFFGIEAILCPVGDWKDEIVPTPELVRVSLRERYRRDRDGADSAGDLDPVFRLLWEPAGVTGLSLDVQRLPDGPSVRLRQRSISVPTITFISGRTSDKRTPFISDDRGSRRS
ncbi:DUF6615 family protein [Bosea sp. 685]|uniref:DUF6615 family protein n=1 Tax=Bosea sp. 685 TaxID=3080057 RepID=UPI00289299E2|nr:DUF6615 family protein [Bosea sp. 685]WNJ89618.1 DUF6615 family protein [Bosea sp. 685]